MGVSSSLHIAYRRIRPAFRIHRRSRCRIPEPKGCTRLCDAEAVLAHSALVRNWLLHRLRFRRAYVSGRCCGRRGESRLSSKTFVDIARRSQCSSAPSQSGLAMVFLRPVRGAVASPTCRYRLSQPLADGHCGGKNDRFRLSISLGRIISRPPSIWTASGNAIRSKSPCNPVLRGSRSIMSCGKQEWTTRRRPGDASAVRRHASPSGEGAPVGVFRQEGDSSADTAICASASRPGQGRT